MHVCHTLHSNEGVYHFMRKLEMLYYNIYYYCNIANNILYNFNNFIDWASTGAQFTEPFFEVEPEDFPKYSALHLFCEYTINQLIYEESENQFDVVQNEYDSLEIDDKKKRLSVAMQNTQTFDFEIDKIIKYYEKKHKTFFEYLLENDFTYFVDAYNDFRFYNDEIDDLIIQLAKEMFYVLLQNRTFLFEFNKYLSNSNPYGIKRVNIPSWVKRTVKFRDRGRCIDCGKDISGLLDTEEDNSVHFDHIISLKEGGINDVSNIQLMCRDCNLKKSAESYTTANYYNWYDDEE